MEKLERVKVLGDRIEVEIGRHIIGQKELIQDTLICLFAGGESPAGRCAGSGQDEVGEGAWRGFGIGFQAYPVHA